MALSVATIFVAVFVFHADLHATAGPIFIVTPVASAPLRAVPASIVAIAPFSVSSAVFVAIPIRITVAMHSPVWTHFAVVAAMTIIAAAAHAPIALHLTIICPRLVAFASCSRCCWEFWSGWAGTVCGAVTGGLPCSSASKGQRLDDASQIAAMTTTRMGFPPSGYDPNNSVFFWFPPITDRNERPANCGSRTLPAIRAIRNKAAERSTRRPVIVALRGGELASAVAERCLPCHSTGRAGLSEARRVAIVSGQRSPTTEA